VADLPIDSNLDFTLSNSSLGTNVDFTIFRGSFFLGCSFCGVARRSLYVLENELPLLRVKL
jgi:hypothetical protein